MTQTFNRSRNRYQTVVYPRRISGRRFPEKAHEDPTLKVGHGGTVLRVDVRRYARSCVRKLASRLVLERLRRRMLLCVRTLTPTWKTHNSKDKREGSLVSRGRGSTEPSPGRAVDQAVRKWA
jgi:hypothetical protein